jgi:hypothetical protein
MRFSANGTVRPSPASPTVLTGNAHIKKADDPAARAEVAVLDKVTTRIRQARTLITILHGANTPAVIATRLTFNSPRVKDSEPRQEKPMGRWCLYRIVHKKNYFLSKFF